MLKTQGFKVKKLLSYAGASNLLKRGTFFCLRRDTEKLLQGEVLSPSGPTSHPSHSNFLMVSRIHQILSTSGPLHIQLPQFHKSGSFLSFDHFL